MIRNIFITLIVLLFYAYIGYPVLVSFLSLLFTKKINKSDYFPPVSLIIAAFNEENGIEEKLLNSISLEYPKDKLEIIVASDASFDKTDQIVCRYKSEGVILCRQEIRSGKTEVQNKAAAVAKGEILIFSDATAIYNKDCINAIVTNFADNSVGGVEGRLVIYSKNQDHQVVDRSLFTKLETFIRLKESCLNSVLGVSGQIYAVRKKLYKPLHKDLVSDLAISFVIVSQGYRMVFEPKAVAFEESSLSFKQELRRNIRTVCQGWGSLSLMKTQFKHILYSKSCISVFFQFFSHKLIRWLSPFILLLLLVLNVWLVVFHGSGFYLALLFCQIFFYGLALMGLHNMENKYRFSNLLQPLSYFCVYNFASFLGFIKFLNGDKKAIWQPPRKS